MLKKFKLWLQGSSNPEGKIDEIRFDPPNLQGLAIELDIDKRAKANGEKEIPPPEDTSPDGVHQEIYQTVNYAFARAIEGSGRDALSGLTNNITDTINRIDPGSLKAIPDQFEKDLEQLEQDMHLDIEESKKNYLGKKEEYDRFKQENHLQRDPAEYSKPKFWGFLALLMLGQCVINSYFFKEASDQGFFYKGNYPQYLWSYDEYQMYDPEKMLPENEVKCRELIKLHGPLKSDGKPRDRR